ncbi:MAG: amidohydrolase [Treponema sp.]|nr:amidohydrolase [Treponema sp.]
MNANKQQLINVVDSKAKDICAINDSLWDFPEVRFKLPKSADLLCNYLKGEGFSIQRGMCGMDDAFIATYGNSGPVIGILGEYDALPTMSQVSQSLEKKSCVEGGAGQGCGHQALGAGSAGAVAALKAYLEKSGAKATIKYFGCPGEESGSGKAYMARGGAFDGVDAFFTWHPMNETQAWGFSTLANYQVWFRFKGISAHAAATPHLGRSALDACELMNVGVNYLREHIVPEARVHYAYTDVGGGAPNVVQSTASLLYFIRAPKSAQVREIYNRVVDIAKGAALMSGTTMEIEWDSACSEYIVTPALAELCHNNLVELGALQFSAKDLAQAEEYRKALSETDKTMIRAKLAKAFKGEAPERIEAMANKPLWDDIFPLSITDWVLPGSTDVGDASWKAPTGQFVVGMYPAGFQAHSWQWVALGKSEMVHKGILHAAKAMAMSALDLIENPALLEKAKAEWKAALGGETYNCAIPAEVVPK